MNTVYLWLIAAVVLAGGDMVFGTIYLLIIAGAALIGALAAFADCDLTTQFVWFSIIGIAGCVAFSLLRRKRKQLSANQLQDVNIGHIVTVHEVNASGGAVVFWRGTRWEAVSANQQPLSPGQWKIVGNQGNTLLLSSKE